MIGSSVLLDTSVVIELFKGDKTTLSRLKQFDRFYLSSTALGELYLGAFRSNSPLIKLTEIDAFLQACNVLQVTATTAAIYGKLKASLLNKGKPMPENDIWIAAIAVEYELMLYSHDRHFREVEGLLLFV